MNSKKKVLVALSGGVDSSVSAALLQKEGYEVEGAFIKTWTVPWLPCTWREERRDAMRVAAQLGIPFHTIDLSVLYETQVVQYMIDAYKAGYTPNPDVMCNKHIKFGGFYDWAMSRGFDYIATGHYARTQEREGVLHLLQGIDKQKDQTYFLWTLTESQLEKVLFPIGEYEKKDVRTLATSFHLVTADKKDSQGICFLGKVDMKSFLQHYITASEGAVLNLDGEVIGTHDGALFFTLGQRHGFSIKQKRPDTPALYVVEKDIENNTITVASRPQSQTQALDMVPLTQVHFIQDACNPAALSCQARIRYRQPLFPVTLKKDAVGTFHATLSTPQAYVANGQSMVFYQHDACIGGGVIGG